MTCSICEKEIETQTNGYNQGHNASPVNDGRCCNSCNWDVVIPKRMGNINTVRKEIKP